MTGNLVELIAAEAEKRANENRLLHASTLEAYRAAVNRAADGTDAKPSEAKQLMEILGRLNLAAGDFVADVEIIKRHRLHSEAGGVESHERAKADLNAARLNVETLEIKTLPEARRNYSDAMSSEKTIYNHRATAESLERSNPRLFESETNNA